MEVDEFAKQLEATSIRNVEEEGEYQENGEFISSNPMNTNPGSTGDNLDEEWKPFDSEDNKDYSGLRIKIQNWKVEDEENNNEGQNDEQEKKVACPWGTCSSTNKQALANEEKLAQEEAKPETNVTETSSKPVVVEPSPPAVQESAPAPSTYVPPHLRNKAVVSTDKAPSTDGGKYIPPSLRNKTTLDQQPAIPATSVNSRRPNKSQPNIMDTMEFPTLNAAVSEPAAGEKLSNGGER